MRRIFVALAFLLILATSVSAASSVTGLQSSTNVSSDGTCHVILTVQLRLEEVPGDLYFPLPGQAKDISLNGSPARSSLSGGRRNVDLSGAVSAAGSYTFVIQYSLPDSVTIGKGDKLTLNLELLSGFAYPIQKMDFSVTLPGLSEKRPQFTSTYHQENVETLIQLQYSGNTVSGAFTQSLKDHETLSMALDVSQELFPQSISKKWSLSTDDIAMYLCAAAALVYWLLTMRSLPPKRIRSTRPPEGVSAGALGSYLTGQGADLTLTVISWAQMGYILIQLDDNGRVLLHKRMDMGNERSDFEARCFRDLFGRKRTVDGTGYHYARLCRKAARFVPGTHINFLRRSGNPKIFRALCAGIGVFAGISLAAAFANDTFWQVVLSLLFAGLGAVFCWVLQAGAGSIHSGKKLPLYLGLAFSVLWLLLSALAAELIVGIAVVLSQWLAGLAVCYGRRRTGSGKQNMAQILGLRRYLRSLSKQELQTIMRMDPEYFYRMAPYALALGVDKAFARAFGGRKLPECTYLTTGMDGHMTAREWNQLLRDAAQALDERQTRLPLEKLMGK